MRIGILGSGLMGGKLGTIWARAGHEVVFSYSHSEQKLKSSRGRLKGRRGGHTRAMAAMQGSGRRAGSPVRLVARRRTSRESRRRDLSAMVS